MIIAAWRPVPLAAAVGLLFWIGRGGGTVATPQDVFAIPVGPRATIDGTISAGEPPPSTDALAIFGFA